MANIADKLNELSELQASLDMLRLIKDEQRAVILAPVKQQLADLEAEYADAEATTAERIGTLNAEIRAAVLLNGETVKGAHLQAVYMRGRASWNTKALDGYAVAHPEIGAFKTIGEPSVSVRKV